MKILLVAYNCSPDAGSEDGVGWNMLKTLSMTHDVVVVTRGLFKQKIEAQHLLNKGHRVRFEYVNNPVSRESVIYRKFYQQLYYLWQLKAAFRVRQLTKTKSFDVIQHVTWVRCWMPSAIIGAVSGKLIWGPVGGVEATPMPFLKKWLSGRGEEYTKHVIAWCSQFDPIMRLLARKVTVGLATTPEAAAYMKKLGCRDVKEQLAVALSQDRLQEISMLPQSDSVLLRFVSIDRLLSWKGFQYGLEGFAEANLPCSEYWLVGAGTCEKQLRDLTEKLGIQRKVRFFGQVEQSQAIKLLSQCHVLVHPSFRDSGGFVCLEAMAARRPVICLNLGGPAVQVTHETGFVIDAISPSQVVGDIANAMIAYANDEMLVRQHGIAGLERVKTYFTWDKNEAFLSEIYSEVLGTKDG